MTFDLPSVLGIATLLSLGVGAFVAWMRSTMRADLAALKEDLSEAQMASDKSALERNQVQMLTFGALRESILDRIDARLADFVRTQTFKDYVESHAKEHLRIEQELMRFRDWKHDDADPLLRKHDALLTKDDETK